MRELSRKPGMGDDAPMRMGVHVRKTAIGFILCALLLPAGPVAADQTLRRDGDDIRSFLDIAWVKHQHIQLADGSMRIRHTISMHDRWSPRWLFQSGCGDLSIWIDEIGGDAIYFSYDGELKAHLNRRRVAAWRPNRRSVAVQIRPRVLAGDDRTYRWRARSLATQDPSCEGGSRAWEDFAPNDRWIRHDLP